jgi:hypothetical protein
VNGERQQKKVEMLFADLKRIVKLDLSRQRGILPALLGQTVQFHGGRVISRTKDEQST